MSKRNSHKSQTKKRKLMQSTLTTGHVVATSLINIVMISLENLITQNPIVFYELVQISLDHNHKLFGNADKILRNLKLIETDGQPRDVIRLIVLAA